MKTAPTFDRYRVTTLNQPVRFGEFTSKQLLFLSLICILVIVLLNALPFGTQKIAGIPQPLLVLIVSMTGVIGATKAVDLRPLSWWRTRLNSAGKSMPLYLPTISMLPSVRSEEVPARLTAGQ